MSNEKVISHLWNFNNYLNFTETEFDVEKINPVALRYLIEEVYNKLIIMNSHDFAKKLLAMPDKKICVVAPRKENDIEDVEYAVSYGSSESANEQILVLRGQSYKVSLGECNKLNLLEQSII